MRHLVISVLISLDQELSENVWFVWSKTSYSGDVMPVTHGHTHTRTLESRAVFCWGRIRNICCLEEFSWNQWKTHALKRPFDWGGLGWKAIWQSSVWTSIFLAWGFPIVQWTCPPGHRCCNLHISSHVDLFVPWHILSSMVTIWKIWVAHYQCNALAPWLLCAHFSSQTGFPKP